MPPKEKAVQLFKLFKRLAIALKSLGNRVNNFFGYLFLRLSVYKSYSTKSCIN